VTIETEEPANQPKYAGLALNPMVKTQVTYARSDESDRIKYETLWFCHGKTMGLERCARLSIPPRAAVAINIVHKGVPTEPFEFDATAQSILRVYADIRLISKSSLERVVVADALFPSIIKALSKEHFQPATGLSEDQSFRQCQIFITDQSAHQALYLCYSP
jgi:hypothetical protein